MTSQIGRVSGLWFSSEKDGSACSTSCSSHFSTVSPRACAYALSAAALRSGILICKVVMESSLPFQRKRTILPMAPNGKKDGSESGAGEGGLTIESSGNPGGQAALRE